MDHIDQMYNSLRELLDAQAPVLKAGKESELSVEYTGTKEVMQGKQKVSGHYFATLMQKPKDLRFYFFPIYTHANEYAHISPEVRKFLKGKSCFHIKRLDEKMIQEMDDMVKKGIQLYQKDQWI